MSNTSPAIFRDPLSGRALIEGWDVNPPHLLAEHYVRTQGQIRTRFPPEPNGYAHFGHGKSCYMNFKEAFDKLSAAKGEPVQPHVTFRYDDTNPEAESQEFIDSIAESVRWLGWTPNRTTFTSDYFEQLYGLAEQLIREGKAYVCHQTGDEIEASRRVCRALHAGQDVHGAIPESPWRDTPTDANLKKLRDMRRGVYAESEASLRMKIDMRHVNPNLWDPVAYRIMYHPHPRTGNKWCIYPTYDFSHCIIDSLEDIDYSICTLEFENRRESYFWLLDALGLYRPKVFEMARLDVTRTVMSKRKLKRLVETKQVRGWDDPRMPTLMGMRRRGFTKDMINAFMGEIGITRAMSKIPMERFLAVAASQLDESAPRVFGLVHPVSLTLTNLAPAFCVQLEAPLYPQKPSSLGDNTRRLVLSRRVFVEQSNCRAQSDPAFYGFFPGQLVRLRYGPVVRCTKVETNAEGKVVGLEAVAWIEGEPDPEPLPAHKPKGVVHWLSAYPGERPLTCELRLYDHLFPEGDELPDEIAPNSEVVVPGAMIEPIVLQLAKDKLAFAHMQFERLGYFVADCVDSTPQALVLNRTVELASFVQPQQEEKAAPARASSVSRAEQQNAQRAAKAERLKYPPHELFKRPGEDDKWAEWDELGIPTRAAGQTEVLSKSKRKELEKEWKKHKEEWEQLQKS